jgi:release factor glutamine methyltransferase
MPEDTAWTVLPLLKTSADYLVSKAIDSPRLVAELLLTHTLGLKNRTQLYADFERPVTPSELAAFRGLFKRRLAGEPLQYLTGTQQFFEYDFLVDSRVLIPRPETEELTELVLQTAKSALAETPLRILDIGTGSGCIALTLAKKLASANVVGVDVSLDAVAVARENQSRLNVANAELLQADGLAADFAVQFKEPFHIIVSNPPYIPMSEKETLEPHVVDFEPHLALFDETGFRFYEKISRDAQSLLAPNGVLFFELHADAAANVTRLLQAAGFLQIDIKKDMVGFERFAIARR